MDLFQITRALQTQTNGTMPPKMTIPLWKATEDGSEERIMNADLYRYQRYRWLSGEAEKLAMRYRKFHLGGLVDATIKATGSSRNRCTKWVKCVEGQYNKASVLTFDTGDQLIARLPNPNAGPAFFTTASEVTTREFLREFLDMPIPRIHAWSAETSNPVGAEYIMAAGLPLGRLWSEMSMNARLHMVDQIADMEKRLSSASQSMAASTTEPISSKSRKASHH